MEPFESLTSVPRPPTLIVPNRRKGAETVIMFGVTCRTTETEEGWGGINLAVDIVTSSRRIKVVKPDGALGWVCSYRELLSDVYSKDC